MVDRIYLGQLNDAIYFIREYKLFENISSILFMHSSRQNCLEYVR